MIRLWHLGTLCLSISFVMLPAEALPDPAPHDEIRKDQPAPVRGTSPDEDSRIQMVFDKHKKELYHIYKKALRCNPRLSGAVRYQIKIDERGKVAGIEPVHNTIEDLELVRAMAEAIGALDFAEVDIRGVSFIYPIELWPGKSRGDVSGAEEHAGEGCPPR